MPYPTKKLGEVCEVVGGGTPSTSNPQYWGDDVFWMTPKNLGHISTIEVADTDTKISMQGLEHSSAKILPPGSVILSSRAPIGYVAINTVEMATNQGCRSFICNKELYNRYLYYFLKISTDLMYSMAGGSTFAEISGSKLKELEIPLPALPEQKKIVKKIEELFGKIDEAQKLREEALADAAALIPSALHQIFEKGKQKGWEEILFGDEKYLKIIDGDRGKEYPKKSDFEPEGYCLFLNTGNVRKGNFNFSKCDFISKERDELLRKGRLERGDVVLTTRGTLGNSAFYNDAVPYERLRINSGMVLLRVSPKKVSQEYLMYILKTPDFIQKVIAANSGSAQPQLPIRVFSKISFLLPPLPEQKKIVAYLDSLSEKAKKLQELQSQTAADLKALKQSILHKAFKGELIK